jgi:hypothetical protein
MAAELGQPFARLTDCDRRTEWGKRLNRDLLEPSLAVDQPIRQALRGDRRSIIDEGAQEYDRPVLGISKQPLGISHDQTPEEAERDGIDCDGQN